MVLIDGEERRLWVLNFSFVNWVNLSRERINSCTGLECLVTWVEQ